MPRLNTRILHMEKIMVFIRSIMFPSLHLKVVVLGVYSIPYIFFSEYMSFATGFLAVLVVSIVTWFSLRALLANIRNFLESDESRNLKRGD